jgi:MFS family permease
MIPRHPAILGISVQKMALLVPAYLIPYEVSTLFFGLLSDWLGRTRIMLASLTACLTDGLRWLEAPQLEQSLPCDEYYRS